MKRTILLVFEDGYIQRTLSVEDMADINIAILDYDVQPDAIDEDIIQVPQGEGKFSDACGCILEINKSKNPDVASTIQLIRDLDSRRNKESNHEQRRS